MLNADSLAYVLWLKYAGRYYSDLVIQSGFYLNRRDKNAFAVLKYLGWLVYAYFCISWKKTEALHEK